MRTQMVVAAELGASRPKDAVRAGGSRALKILHIFDHSLPILSGYSVRSAAILKEQRRRGWETVHLTTPKHTEVGPSPEKIGDFSFHRTGPLPAWVDPVFGAKESLLISRVAREVEQLARIEKPDVLHAHSPALNGAAALIAAKRLRLPVVYEIRAFWEDAAVTLGTASAAGLRYRLTRALESHVLRRCNAAVTICEGLRSDIVERGISAEKTFVVANGVQLEEFPFHDGADVAIRSKFGLDGRVVLGFIGSFYAYEGLDLLLSAMPAVHRINPSISLLLVGSGPVERRLKEQAVQLGLGDTVRFEGQVPRERVHDYYRLVDIFVYPRHRMRLTDTVTPLKPMEAMAHGAIVLASNVGGHRELVRDCETGRLFRADDARALVNSILDLASKSSDWPEMRKRARAFVERERTWATTAKPYTDVYARALSDIG